jgi:hypothetical protein
MQTITKVKFKKDGQKVKTEIHWVEENANGTSEEVVLVSDDPRHADFDEAMDELPWAACRLLELPLTYISEMKCTGVSVSQGEDEGVTLTVQKVLQSGPTAVLNTAHTTDLTSEIWGRIEGVRMEAGMYAWGGKRAQLSMDFEARLVTRGEAIGTP